MKFYANVVQEKITYNIEKVENYFDKLENKVNIFGGTNIFNSGKMGDITGNIFGNNNDVTHNAQTLSDEQWETLIHFFESRAESLAPGSAARASCQQMCVDAQRKDAPSLKKRIQEAGRETFKIIIGNSLSSIIKSLLEIILKA